MDEDNKVIRVQTFNVRPSLANTKKLVTELMAFIDKNNLSTQIAGKKYLQVEAWQFAGSQLNLTAIVTDLQDLSTETNTKYKATVEVMHNPTGQLVSRGFAICSKKESKKSSFDEYAIASMAQTRAIGKAYRNILAWLVKMAGFEGTPAEELSDNTKEEMTANLQKKKAELFALFKQLGIDDSTVMLEKIGKATHGKQTLENIDDIERVINYLNEEIR